MSFPIKPHRNPKAIGVCRRLRSKDRAVPSATAPSSARTERWRIKAMARRFGGYDVNAVFAFAWFSNEPLPYAGNASGLRCYDSLA